MKDHGARHLRGPAMRGTHSAGQGRETRDGLVARPHAGAQARLVVAIALANKMAAVDLGDADEATRTIGIRQRRGLRADRRRYAGDVRRSENGKGK